MKSVVLGAAVAATLTAAVPASAKLLFVIVRTSSFVTMNTVGTRHRSWYRDRAECRTMRVRTHLPNGKVVIKTRRSC